MRPILAMTGGWIRRRRRGAEAAEAEATEAEATPAAVQHLQVFTSSNEVPPDVGNGLLVPGCHFGATGTPPAKDADEPNWWE